MNVIITISGRRNNNKYFKVSGYLDIKLHNLPPFGLKIRKIYRKYAKRGQIVKF